MSKFVWFSVAIDGRNFVVGIAIRYGLDSPGIEFRCGEIFRAVETTHPITFTMGLRVSSLEVKGS